MKEILIKNTKLVLFKQDLPIIDLFTRVDKTPELIFNKKVVRNNISGVVPHKNYAEYLRVAYNNDYGIIIDPAYIWFTIMCTVAEVVKNSPEQFRVKFTTKSKDKEKILLIISGGPEDDLIEMQPQKMLKKLLSVLPTEINEGLIIPKISTSTPEFKFACAAAFLDTASPYYSKCRYGYSGCMFNKIKIVGTLEDFHILKKCMSNISSKIGIHHTFDKIIRTLERIENNYENDEFWKRILWTEDAYLTQTLNGWIIDFTIYGADYAIVEYDEYITDKHYALCTGLFSSKIENGYLVPSFEKFVVCTDEEVDPLPLKDQMRL